MIELKLVHGFRSLWGVMGLTGPGNTKMSSIFISIPVCHAFENDNLITIGHINVH